MKQLVYIFLSLCSFVFYSCGMTEPWKDWENEGNLGENRLRPSEVKSLLCGKDAWKTTYKGVDFYLQFDDGGKVISDTDKTILENEVESDFVIDFQGEDIVLLKLDNSGAFQYLPDGGINTIYITDYSDNQMKANDGTGVELFFQAVSEQELSDNLADKHQAIVDRNKAHFQERLKTDLNYGVFKDASGRFLAHYKILNDGDENQIQMSVLENRILTHTNYTYSIDMSRDDKAIIELGFTSLKGKQVSKLYYKYQNGEFTTDTDVKVLPHDMTSLDYYKNNLTTLKINAYDGEGTLQGDAKESLWNELNAYPVRGIEINDRSQRPLIFCGSNYTSYDANYTISDDIITFHNTTPPYSVVGWEAKPQDVENAAPNFLSAYFHEDGFYLVYEVTDKTRLYFLSSTTDNWFMADK